jgi:subtilase family serine protease
MAVVIFGTALLIFGTPGFAAVQRRALHGHVPGPTKNLAAIDSLPDSLRLNLSIGLPLRNEDALAQLLEQLYDPASPLYGRYLTPQEFADRFGPTQKDYKELTGFLEARGLTVTATHGNRLLLEVSGTVSQIQNVFATKLNVYQHPKENRRFFAPEMEPSVESGVSILDIAGLDNFVVPRPASLRPMPLSVSVVPNAGTAPGGAYRGNDFRAAYLPGVTLSGSGQSVALLEFDGYYASDIATYEAQAGLRAVPLQNILLSGFDGTPGPNNVEVALDIEVAIALAPGLASVLVYEGPGPNTLLNRIAQDNQAKQISSSWTYGINASTENIFRQLAAQGQSMFQASGDNGAYSGSVPTPADDPNVTVVGGTTLSTAGATGAWTSETTWNWANSGRGTNASGGGISTSYAIPSYQKGLDMSRNQGSTTLRNIPDVAMTADNIWVVWDNGSTGAFGGTSAATPLWAAFMALVNQQGAANGRSPIGLANPAIYALGKGSNYVSCFHDITAGNNSNPGSPSKFAAVAGYDLCTGWGTPAGQPLINALTGVTNQPATNAIKLQISLQSNLLRLNWSGASPPFQLQVSTNLVGRTWQNVGGLMTNYNVTVTPGGVAGAYRIQATAP